MADTETEQLNVFGEPLNDCSCKPMTGWYRDGRCATDEHDHGLHTVCIRATAEFLAYSKAKGNDLSTPMPEFGFPGLQPGDQWCLCATRWQEALMAGKAPRVILTSTHIQSLSVIDLADLKKYALDLA